MRDDVGVNDLYPGLTGYAQVKGREFIKDEEKVANDKYYLENMNYAWTLKLFGGLLRAWLNPRECELINSNLLDESKYH